MQDELKNNVLKSGTSILGIVCKDGIIMAADRRATAGNLVMSKNTKKAVKLNDYLVVSGTGMASDIDMLQKVITAELRLKELRSKQRPTVKDAANLISMMSYRNIRTPSMIPSIAGTLVAGYNEDGSFELYTIEPAGSIARVEDYDANFSSGMPFILGLLERQWKKDITVKQGVELALEAIKSSTQRDVGSGNGVDIFAITKTGIVQAVEQTIEPNFR
jgi:proteasome beta subunit